jgi:hypothetical protein
MINKLFKIVYIIKSFFYFFSKLKNFKFLILFLLIENHAFAVELTVIGFTSDYVLDFFLSIFVYATMIFIVPFTALNLLTK